MPHYKSFLVRLFNGTIVDFHIYVVNVRDCLRYLQVELVKLWNFNFYGKISSSPEQSQTFCIV